MDGSSRAAIGAAYDVVADSYAKLLPDSSFESPSDLDVRGIDVSEEVVRISRSRHPTCRVDQGDIARIHL
ncbi:hypothetical protein ASG12_19500 [Williamsia sp. Leaf354]|jgi:hypothetical protein|uniref:hypothetical protein n=1 Tax=Williamsia sp. Leaf354 TaxID=1736349 RepID=UPI0006F76A5C|nr:hypothetical protein [Williamsia sp. Leaf354]KQR96356.1 hypothetical protein ASG12_19500 [Williamsia sp. Leaf354]